MKKDLKEYYVSLQKQFNELQKALEEINKEIAEGKVTPEQRASFENYFNIVQTNYQRISYAMHLLNKPPKFIQK
jgi:Flp pilus assembly protein TadG